jgi:hypothetical protein
VISYLSPFAPFLRLTTGTVTIVGEELFYFKYYGIAFSILTGRAGGLAL